MPTKSEVEAAHKRAAMFGGKPEDYMPGGANELAKVVKKMTPPQDVPALMAAQAVAKSPPINTVLGDALAHAAQVKANKLGEDVVIYDESGIALGSVPPEVVPPSRLERVEKAVAASGGFVTKDSGERSQFVTGAVRDTNEGKGRFDLISPIALKRLAQLYERGAKKYGSRNWEKGIPLWRYLDSAERHLNDFKAGDRVEDHLIAVAWNVFGFIHTEEMIRQGKLPFSLATEEKPNG